jgi:hypothetical protein
MPNRTLSLCRAAFERWRGAAVEFAALRRSARTAFLEVTLNDHRYVLQLLDPRRIEANTSWTDCDFVIELCADASGERLFVVSDTGAKFECVCGAVGVSDATQKAPDFY